MTRTISFITATVGAALLFAVPAYGDNWGADKAQPTEQVRVSPDLEDRAIASEQIRLERMLDSRERSLGTSVLNSVAPVDRERALGTKNELTLRSDFYADGFAQALQPQSRPEPVRDDRFRIDPTSGQTPVTVSSGREIEWPQVGIGFGIGMVLLLGLVLVMRAAHIRPFAH